MIESLLWLDGLAAYNKALAVGSAMFNLDVMPNCNSQISVSILGVLES